MAVRSDSIVSGMTQPNVSEPFPIFLVAKRYVLYDVDTISYARREHNITGVLIGGLPQAPQQNVFLGVPLELMPEEARLLVEKGVAYVVDDAQAHKNGFIAHDLSAEEKKAFLSSVRKQGSDAAKVQLLKAEDRKAGALKKIAESNGQKNGDWNDIPDDMFAPRKSKAKKVPRSRPETPLPPIGNASAGASDEDELIFSSGSSNPTPSLPSAPSIVANGHHDSNRDRMRVTPTTSHPPLRSHPPPPQSSLPLPTVPQSYPLFKHMHSKDYFLAPGLRFGCQYMAYPGDPLRFHSHFLCNGMDWDEEFDLLDIVGGGRLGTGVKKGFLIGGEEKDRDSESSLDGDSDRVRPFCIEWGGM